jgi:hypothetical protein
MRKSMRPFHWGRGDPVRSQSVGAALGALPQLADALAILHARPASGTGVGHRPAIGHQAATLVLPSTCIAMPGHQRGQSVAVGDFAGPAEISFRSSARPLSDADAVTLVIHIAGGFADLAFDLLQQLGNAVGDFRRRSRLAWRLLRLRGQRRGLACADEKGAGQCERAACDKDDEVAKFHAPQVA